MNEAATYEMYYVHSDGGVTLRQRKGAPSPAKLFATRPKMKPAESQVLFGIRYYPSKKAWRVFDMRKFEMAPTGRFRFMHLTAPKHEVEYADLDAAIMFATLRLG